jgi:hypothetical protein
LNRDTRLLLKESNSRSAAIGAEDAEEVTEWAWRTIRMEGMSHESV